MRSLFSTSIHHDRYVKIDLFILVALTALVNIPYWDSTIWPFNDTLYVFQSFYSFYNNFFLHGELVQWFPYGVYGISAGYWQLIVLTPISYLTILMGSIFRIRDVLFMFKFSLMLEQIISVLGIYLLSKALFHERLTRLLVCIITILSTVAFMQAYWNFRIYYLLPWVIYFLWRYCNESQGKYFWLAGIFSVFSVIGTLPYFASLHLLLVLILLIGLSLSFRPKVRCLFSKQPSNLTFFAIFVSLAVIYIVLMVHALEGIHSHAIGRDAQSHIVTLDSFLNRGRRIGWPKFLELLLAGPGDNQTLYMGLIPILFLLYGIGKVRSAVYSMFWILTVLLVLFSLGNMTPVSVWLYHAFYPLRYFRYIGSSSSVLHILIPLLAGFGIDLYLRDLKSSPSEATKRFSWVGILILSLVCLAAFGNKLFSWHYLPWFGHHRFAIGLLCFAVLTNLFYKRFEVRKTIFIIVSLCLVADLFGFQQLILRDWPARFSWIDHRASQVRPYSYQAQRVVDGDLDENILAAVGAVDARPVQRITIEAYGFIQFDPPVSQYFISHWSNHIYRLFKERGGYKLQVSGNIIKPEAHLDAGLLGAIAFTLPKLRFVESVIAVSDVQAEEEAIINSDIAQAPVVFIEGASELAKGQTNDLSVSNTITVQHFTYNGLHAQVNVESDQGKWLYYADAYHPGWEAYVDDEPVPIYRANMGFKAIKVASGKHSVRFVFQDGIYGFLSYSLAVLSLIFTLVLLIFLVRFFFFERSEKPLICNKRL